MNDEKQEGKEIEKGEALSRVLGPMHIWALGVGIVLVGEFMGWNFTIAKGGSIGSLAALWLIAILYIMIIMMNIEMGSVMPEAGGQYAMAKYILGPLAAFNVGLMLVFEYAMLEAADALVVGQILHAVNPEINSLPYIILSLLALTYLNYRGVYATLTLNFVITLIAFATIIVLVVSTGLAGEGSIAGGLSKMTDGLPYGFIGIAAAMQFGVWFFLGIEGSTLAAEECRSTSRALPTGAIAGLATLMIGATITWLVCSYLVPAKELGASAYPLFDAALKTGKSVLIVMMFVGTMLACLASANGCINDASRAWFAMSRDDLIPSFFAKTHPKYNTPYRAIVFLLPISLAFAFTGMLDQVVTFSIFSALLVYVLTAIMMIRFRIMYPLGTIDRGYVAPGHPVPAIVALILLAFALFGMYLGYWVNMLGGITFYLLASLWFVKRREKFVDKEKFLKAGASRWPKPHI